MGWEPDESPPANERRKQEEPVDEWGPSLASGLSTGKIVFILFMINIFLQMYMGGFSATEEVDELSKSGHSVH